jgi:signal transduction histidine kinase/ligand-binding sensor domain-containing protein
MHRLVVMLAAGLVLLPLRAAAERLPIRAYTTADGLAHNEVNTIVRDSRGFMWFATGDGLSRFDGYTFTNYSVEQGLPHRRVTDLLETRSGELWVATFGGLVRFRPDHTPMFTTIVPADDDPRARALLTLLESADGTIWCGTRKGLLRLDGNGNRFALTPVAIGMLEEHPEQKYVNGLIEDEHHSLWIATPGGLYRRWSDGTAARYAPTDLVAGRFGPLHRSYDHLHDLTKDRQGRIWATARGLGFFRLAADAGGRPPSVEEVHAYPKPLSSWVEQILETSDGRLWVASNVGLLEWRRDQRGGSDIVAYDRRHGLRHQEITALAEDSAGNLWMGTWASGAMKLTRGGFVTYGREDGLAAGADVFEDATGQRFVFAGIFKNDNQLDTRFGRFDERGFHWFAPGPPYRWGWVNERSILRTRNSEYWLASGAGLFRYPPLPSFDAIATAKPLRIFGVKDGVLDQVYRLFEDSRGDVWFSFFSATNGLFRWSRHRDTLQDMSRVGGLPSLQDELPRAFREDHAGNLWIGLTNGVARYRNGRFAFFKTANGTPVGTIVDIHADAHRVWLASSRTGLIRVEDPSAEAPAFTRYTTAEGLSGNNLEAITEDRYGRLYLATGRGIDRLDPATGAVRQFTTEDGLAAGLTVAASRDSTGALWFGTHTGLSRFVPLPPAASAAPTILITGVTIAGQPWPVSAIGQSSVVLPDLRPGGHHLQIDFASLRFATGDRLRYQYRLEGSDDDWGPPTTRRTISFASFSPGDYRFLVRAVNADGVASPQPAIVAFTVLPPFWLRGWFVALAALTVVAAALALHRVRVARIVELERVRTRIATDLHDDVGANLTRIAILSEVARRQPRAGAPELDAPLSSIADIARESVATMSDIVWAITPDRDTLRDLVRRMRDHAEEVFETRDIRLTLDLPDPVHPARLGVDVRRDLYLVFKEAVNNAARHSRCSTVAIVLRATATELWLEVADDGVGFNGGAGGDGDGNGLGSMRRRAGRLGGTLDVVSTPGSGTAVRLRMPLRDGAMAVHPTRTRR